MVVLVPATGTPAELESVGYTGRTWDAPWNLPRGQVTTTERMPSALLEPGRAAAWAHGPSLDMGGLAVIDPLTGRASNAAALLVERVHGDGLLVVHRGAVVAEWYSSALRPDDPHLAHSCSKTLTTMAIGIAVGEGRIDPAAPMSTYVKELAAVPAWTGVTVQHVLDMSAGFDTEEHYELPSSMYWRYAEAVGYYEPTPEQDQKGVLAFVEDELTRRVDEPGSRFNYASYLTNLLPIALERVYGVPAYDLYEQWIYRRIGAEGPAVVNLDIHGRPIVEGQVSLSLRDFARWAYLYANGGVSLTGDQVVPAAWIDETATSDPARRAAFASSEYAELFPDAEYHNQTWLLEPHRGSMYMLGIHGQHAYIDPAAELVVVGFSSFPDQANALLVASMRQIWGAIAHAVSTR